MEIQVAGIQNCKPVLHTYQIAEQALADAIADGTCWFDVEEKIDPEQIYALMDQSGGYVGMVVSFGDPHKVVISTFFDHEGITTKGTIFKLHSVEETDKRLHYV